MLIGSAAMAKLYSPPALGSPPAVGLAFVVESPLPHAASSMAATMRTAATMIRPRHLLTGFFTLTSLMTDKARLPPESLAAASPSRNRGRDTL